MEFVSPASGDFLYWYNYVKNTANLQGQFNFGFDGCSVPQSLIKALAAVKYRNLSLGLDKKAVTYSNFFSDACRIHDFGYRNFGPQGRYSVTRGDDPDPKTSVDHRFRANMLHSCKSNPPDISLVPDN